MDAESDLRVLPERAIESTISLALYFLACKARVESEEAVFHVMDRGERREAIFGDFFLVTKLQLRHAIVPQSCASFICAAYEACNARSLAALQSL